MNTQSGTILVWISPQIWRLPEDLDEYYKLIFTCYIKIMRLSISTQDKSGVDERQGLLFFNAVRFSSYPVERGAVLLNQREFHTGFDFCGCQQSTRLWSLTKQTVARRWQISTASLEFYLHTSLLNHLANTIPESFMLGTKLCGPMILAANVFLSPEKR